MCFPERYIYSSHHEMQPLLNINISLQYEEEKKDNLT